MKAVVAYGGLGNVMFIYALVCAYRQKGVKSFLFVSDTNLEHNGYELERVFPNASQWRGLNVIQRGYYSVMQKMRNLHYKRYNFPHKLIFFPFSDLHYDQEPVTYFPRVFEKLDKSEYLIGLFQSYKYFEDCKDAIYKEFQFAEMRLSENTRKMASLINNTNSVSIHVRRGDYMSGYYYNMLGNVCDLNYYQRAIKEMMKRVSNPQFFIFSDDKDYVAKKLLIENAIYVDFNSGQDSWQDMYLMTQCNHHIIANSTFSWWGAWLDTHSDKVVVAPSRWFASAEHDEIVPPEWIRV